MNADYDNEIHDYTNVRKHYLSAKDVEDIAIQTCDPIVWKHASQKYWQEKNPVKALECERQMAYAKINMIVDNE